MYVLILFLWSINLLLPTSFTSIQQRRRESHTALQSKMSDPTNVYIASVSGGKCIENTRAPQGICRLRKWNKSAAQQWTMEIQNSDDRVVAFKNVADGQYLSTLDQGRRMAARSVFCQVRSSSGSLCRRLDRNGGISSRGCVRVRS